MRGPIALATHVSRVLGRSHPRAVNARPGFAVWRHGRDANGPVALVTHRLVYVARPTAAQEVLRLEEAEVAMDVYAETLTAAGFIVEREDPEGYFTPALTVSTPEGYPDTP